METCIDKLVNVKFVILEKVTSRELRLKIIKNLPSQTNDEYYLIELLDDLKPEFVFQLKVDPKYYSKLMEEQENSPTFTELIPSIVEFFNNMEKSSDYFLKCTTNSDGNKLKFSFLGKGIFGSVSILQLVLQKISGESLLQYLAAKTEESKRKYEEAEETINRLQSMNKKLNDQLIAAQENVKKLKTEKEELEEELEEMDDLKDERNQAYRSIETLESQLEDVKLTLKHRDEDVEALERDISDLNAENGNLLDEKEAYLIELEKTKEILGKVAEKGKKREREVIDLRRILSEYKSELNELKYQNEDAESELISQRKNVESLLDDKKELERKLEEEKERNQTLQIQLDLAKQQIDIKKRQETAPREPLKEIAPKQPIRKLR